MPARGRKTPPAFRSKKHLFVPSRGCFNRNPSSEPAKIFHDSLLHTEIFIRPLTFEIKTFSRFFYHTQPRSSTSFNQPTLKNLLAEAGWDESEETTLIWVSTSVRCQEEFFLALGCLVCAPFVNKTSLVLLLSSESVRLAWPRENTWSVTVSSRLSFSLRLSLSLYRRLSGPARGSLSVLFLLLQDL